MNFTSEIFLFYFLPIILFLYYFVKQYSLKASYAILSIGSLVFYAWEVPYYAFIILFSVLVDWSVVKIMVGIQSKSKRLVLLLVSLITNIGLLSFFKYSGFFIENFAILGNALGISSINSINNSLFNNIILPIGISFYTFQTLSYTIDIYDGKVKKARNFTEFLFYVTSFPQLVAGPIVRYSELRSQLFNPTITRKNIEYGLFFFIIGLSKKVLIADSVAPLAELVFDKAVIASGIINLLGVIAYTLQIYFDFSAYSDMAIGLGLFLGFRFPQNFNSPYKASSITDFWRRWHITLSSWIKDYVYIKLGGNRCGVFRNNLNLIVTLVIFGFWHGAEWTFLVWGLGHGFAIFVDRYLVRGKGSVFSILRRFWCIFAVILLWIPFRATNIDGAFMILNNIIFNISDLDYRSLFNVSSKIEIIVSLIIIPTGILISLFGKNLYEMKKKLSYISSLYLTVLFLVSVLVLLSRDYTPFLYFQF